MSFFTSFLSRFVGPYLKAHAAGIGAGLCVLISDTNGKIGNIGSLTGSQWLDALAATGLLGMFVGILGNRPFVAPTTIEAPLAAPAAAVAVDVPAAVSQDSGA